MKTGNQDKIVTLMGKKDAGLTRLVTELSTLSNGLSPAMRRTATTSRSPRGIWSSRSWRRCGRFSSPAISGFRTSRSKAFSTMWVLPWIVSSTRFREQIRRGLCFTCLEESQCTPVCDDQAGDITRSFLERLPAIQKCLAKDVKAGYEGDPAASQCDEVLFCYPAVMAVTNHRLAHELHVLGVPLIPRMITEHAHSVTGIDIHPGAPIGAYFFIDHGTGVVIGETCVIGRHVQLYQGVTLGAKSFPLDAAGHPLKGMARHPVVEDGVIIYSGATILGRVRSAAVR